MAINFEEITSVIEDKIEPLPDTRTVLDEINARQSLVNNRFADCGHIKPFYVKMKKPPHRYNYKYWCVCPRFNPNYACKHTGNIIIDRDVLTQEEHIVYLATPKANFAAPRKMPRYFLKKSIIPNCTPRIIRLAKPDLKQVTDTLNNFNNIISRRHKKSLTTCLLKPTTVEYTTIQGAVDLLCEEKRLRRVAKRKEKLRCIKLSRKIVHKQRRQIKKIICILFTEMEEFLLNDQFCMNEGSTLGTVILEALREFTDKEFHITNNLREYQKILSFNLAIWINKFISNLNIHVAESAPQYSEITQTLTEKPTQELSSFLPVGGYVMNASETDNARDDDDEVFYSYHALTSERTLRNKSENPKC